MKPNNTFITPLEKFEVLNSEFEFFPRGVLAEISVNPYNGNIVLRYQDYKEAIKLLHSVIDQLFPRRRLALYSPLDIDKVRA